MSGINQDGISHEERTDRRDRSRSRINKDRPPAISVLGERQRLHLSVLPCAPRLRLGVRLRATVEEV